MKFEERKPYLPAHGPCKKRILRMIGSVTATA